MPHWLRNTLLLAALLTVIAFLTEPLVTLRRRRRQARRAPGSRGTRSGRQPDLSGPGGQVDSVPGDCARGGHGQHGAERAVKIVQADHERLVVTYSVRDDTVYLLTPPGEDPWTVLRAARLVLPQQAYEEVARYLGLPFGWLLE